MITFNNVSKQFSDESYALKNITLDVADGEFVFLIGPSGAGKSTFLRLLIRAAKASEGEVYVDDWDVKELHRSQVFQLRRMIGMVFQDFKILEARTVFENVALALEILGKKKDEIEQEVEDILELVGLSDKLHYFPQQLSAGEQQRVSLARAIVGGPNILLADEPTGNLDPDTAKGILDILHEVNKIGTTVIVATHNHELVSKMNKRTILLKNGKVVSDSAKGTKSSTKSTPTKSAQKTKKK